MSKDIILSQQHIENKIYNVRGVQIMLDSDLAEIYAVSTGRLNEQVKRNIERFPDDFMFQLTQEEWNYLMSQSAKSSLTSQNATLENKQGKHRKYLPYVFTEQGVSEIIRSAKKSIILIDNYIDENTLTHLAKKAKAVKVLLLTKTVSKQLTLDVKKANEQYSNFELKPFTKSHDRFLIVDDTEVYHLGASLKDLGKKWFAFSRLDKTSVETILKEIGNV